MTRTAVLLLAGLLRSLRDWLFPPPPPEPDLDWMRRRDLTVNYRPRLRQVAARCYLCGYRGRAIVPDGDEATCPKCGKETMSAD